MACLPQGNAFCVVLLAWARSLQPHGGDAQPCKWHRHHGHLGKWGCPQRDMAWLRYKVLVLWGKHDFAGHPFLLLSLLCTTLVSKANKPPRKHCSRGLFLL